ncbi:hypothetical protein DAETH_16750 [Deinococcus aetherius]|uniref:Uncharacterized protein n=1 Tax=Deinococcus aetherius TaxID=200252 RepID=A0ABN6RHJ5_9DEIO|nr:hypothetical protein DAETH_16750 [Deinococcus aetherius]
MGFQNGRQGVNGYKSLAQSVISNPDEVRVGSYGNWGKDVQLYRQGDFVAVITKDGKFITMAQSDHIPSFARKATAFLKLGCLGL